MHLRYARRIGILLSLALLYGALTERYRPNDLDTPWFLSFSYNACHGGVETDEFEGARYPNGMDGVHLFGKLAAGTQCAVFNRIGWTPRGAVLLNVLFGMGSFWLWWAALRRIGYGELWVSAFIVMLGLMGATVSMMEEARYEFFAFFLLSLAIWLGARGLELAAAFVAGLAVETEPGALLVVVAVLAFLSVRTENRRLLYLKAMGAWSLALAIYVGLHPGAIREMAEASRVAWFARNTDWGGALLVDVAGRWKHLPELAMLTIGAWLYWRRRAQMQHPLSVWPAVICGGCLVVAPHLNPAYMVFAIPFILWPVLEGFARSPRSRWVPGAVCLFLLVQYGYRYKANQGDGFTTKDFVLLREQIAQSADTLHIPPDQVRIAGDYRLWFAHPAHYRVLGSTDSLRASNLYLCFDGPLQVNDLTAGASMRCAEMRGLVSARELSSLELRGHRVYLYAPLQTAEH